MNRRKRYWTWITLIALVTALVGFSFNAGLAAALAVTRLLAGFLYGVSPFDSATFIGVPLLLAAIAVLACWLPASRPSSSWPPGWGSRPMPCARSSTPRWPPKASR